VAQEKDKDVQYTPEEELVHIITHGTGIGLSLVGLAFLILKAKDTGDPWYMADFIIFGTSLVLMYISSTLYHSVSDENIKRYFRKLDHAAIYLLIAGTYTPFLLTCLQGTKGWIMFGIVWLFAFVGIIIKLATQIRSKWVSAIIYLVMGWLAVFIARPMIENLPPRSLIFLLAGGMSYSIGVIFYLRKKLKYHHAIWHLYVMGGSICHYFAVYYAAGF
jgi:hemolysin III